MLEDYELIQTRDLLALTPDELTTEQISNFFGANHNSWKPYAAGLPWPRAPKAEFDTLEKFRRLTSGDSQNEAWINQLLVIPSQSGAGGTTFARSIAHSAAKMGIPTLVARSHPIVPEALSISGFLFRCKQILNQAMNDDHEPTWLIVYDLHHWQGRETTISAFLNELTRSGRRAICAIVTTDVIPDALESTAQVTRLPTLTHELSLEESLNLGRHLNIFLRPHGRDKSEQDWKLFWYKHSTTTESPIASFWISLEFWLRGLVDLSTSIQAWLLEQFVRTELSPDARRVILEIAALTIERKPLPEMLMGCRKIDGQPVGVRLGQISNEVPSLALAFGAYTGAICLDVRT